MMFDLSIFLPGRTTADNEEPCGAIDERSGAVCTAVAGHPNAHADRSDPGLVILWFSQRTKPTIT